MTPIAQNAQLVTDLDANEFFVRNLGQLLPVPPTLVDTNDPRLADNRAVPAGSVLDVHVSALAGIEQSKLDLDDVIPVGWLGTDAAAQGDLVERTSRKGAASGYAELDSNGLVLLANLPSTGPGAGTLNTVHMSLPSELSVSTSISSLVSSYSEGFQDASFDICSDCTGQAIGQSFLVLASITLDHAVFYIRKSVGATGTAYAKLYAVTGTYGVDSRPTGSALATSDPVDVSGLSTGFQLISFHFSGAERFPLVASTHYVITLEFLGGSSGSSHWVTVGVDASPFGGAPPGNVSALVTGTWFGSTANALCFYVYGAGDPPPDPTSLSESGNFDVAWANQPDGSWFGTFTSGRPGFHVEQIPIGLIPNIDATKFTSGVFTRGLLPVATPFGVGHAQGTVPDPGDGISSGNELDYLGRDMAWHTVERVVSYQPRLPAVQLTLLGFYLGQARVKIFSPKSGSTLFYRLVDPEFAPIANPTTILVDPGSRVQAYAAKAGWNNSVIATYTAPPPP